jgi:hypothetical protein
MRWLRGIGIDEEGFKRITKAALVQSGGEVEIKSVQEAPSKALRSKSRG